MATQRDVSILWPRVQATLIVVLLCLRWGLVASGVLLGLLLSGAFASLAPPERAVTTDHIVLDILPVRPGGPAEDYAAYVATTSLRVPAHHLITVTIRNFDLDSIPLRAGSPYTQVQGTADGVAYANGVPYTALDRRSIAHTFTIPTLHLNVPIPGQAPPGMSYVTVQFHVRTGASGAFDWRCHAPCGDGPDGLEGAMTEVEYMRGTLYVEP